MRCGIAFVLVLVLVGCSGCSSSSRSGRGHDGGGVDASDVIDAAKAADLGGGDAVTASSDDLGDMMVTDASTHDALPDPGSCPVGAADGCCPQGIVFGGTDPDCAALSCATLATSPDAIALEADWQTDSQSGIGMAWTGSELVLAWQGTRPGSTPGSKVGTIRYQRRDAMGELTFGPVENDDAEITTYPHAQNELGFDPTTHSLFYTGNVIYGRYGEFLDEAGAPELGMLPVTLGSDCNPISSRNQIVPTNAGFLIAQGEESCGAAEAHDPRVDLVGLDGKLVKTWHGDTNYNFGMAWDPTAGRLLFASANSGLRARFFAPTSTSTLYAFTAPTVLDASDAWDSAVAFDGTRFGIVWGKYFFNGSTTAMTPTFTLWSFAGSGPPSLDKSTTLLPDNNLLEVPPRLVWTGDGWLALSTVWVVKTSGEGLPDHWDKFVTWVSSLAPDGTLRETFKLDTHPAYLVNALWAGGRVAVTWVASDGAGRERHYLRYFACP